MKSKKKTSKHPSIKSADTTVNETKITTLVDQVHNWINENPLTIPELILFYGNLGYHLGASIAGFNNTGPTLEELQKAYYADPTVDVGLMLQGLLITTWEESFRQKPRLNSILTPQKISEKKE